MPHKSKYIRPGKPHREMGPEGQGSPGDLRDRMRGVYKPGANPPPKPGLMSPIEAIRKLRKKKPAK